MKIRDMFREDINRKINGVVMVGDDKSENIEQEVREYVITNELKRHFMSFFDAYTEALDVPTENTGVWISGFFGSGKSHFLKMLSYILENKELSGGKTVEYFRRKFEDDPATFMMIDRATRPETETILFNIDVKSVKKDKTAVLRVFAKVFYDHLGFYGDDLKAVFLEQYVERQGKTAEFKAAFEKHDGKPWEEGRRFMDFKGRPLVKTMEEVLGMSEEDARKWFDDKSEREFSIERLVGDIKEYVESKGKNFRLLFMADEVGQYVGTDLSLLIDLQSILEEIGKECRGKVWVVCTGQEALDDVIKLRTDEFSRILARFATKLSLTSSSADEVVQKRVLKKTDEAEKLLEKEYEEKEFVLGNLFSFTGCRGDIVGFSSASEFAGDFPFVPYQFVLIQKVFDEIRRHSDVGFSTSKGERSMLSGFHEAAKAVQERGEGALVPFSLFYDTLISSLDSSIRKVIEDAGKMVEKDQGLKKEDVELLKLLYLVRYMGNDVPATLDNLVILSADNVDTEKVTLRESVRASLDRLYKQNLIGRNGDVYNFLTDEEQDIQREINSMQVNSADVVSRMGSLIFGDIYTNSKYRYKNRFDFAFERMVDDVFVGAQGQGLRLRFLSVVTGDEEKEPIHLMAMSKGQAIVVLEGDRYYELLANERKVDLYLKRNNVSEMPPSAKAIVDRHREAARLFERQATEELRKAIVDGKFYADGEHLELKAGDAAAKISMALEYLVSHVYSEIDLVDKNIENDAELRSVLRGELISMEGLEPNREAAERMLEWLEIQYNKKLPTSMADVQKRYREAPYGWREIDIAAVAAKLIAERKVVAKYAGNIISAEDAKLPDMLQKKSETPNLMLTIRQSASAVKLKQLRDFIQEYFGLMDIPQEEDKLISRSVELFKDSKRHYEEILKKYEGKRYPDKELAEKALKLTNATLEAEKDNIAFIDAVLERENAFLDSKEDMDKVESFFGNQVSTYDKAEKLLLDVKDDMFFLSGDNETGKALDEIRAILGGGASFDYRRIPELNPLVDSVREKHEALLKEKREEMLEIVRQCMEDIHGEALKDPSLRAVSDKADEFFDAEKKRIAYLESIALLNAQLPIISQKRDEYMARMVPPQPKPPTGGEKPGGTPEPPAKNYKKVNMQIAFGTNTVVENEAELDAWLAKVRDKLTKLLADCDGLKLQ